MEKLKEDLKILVESDYWQYLPEATKRSIRCMLGEDKLRRRLHRVENGSPEELVKQQEVF